MRGGNAPRDRALTVSVRRRHQHANARLERVTKPPERRVIKCARVSGQRHCSRTSPPFRYGDHPQRGKGRGESRAAQRLIGCRQPPAQGRSDHRWVAARTRCGLCALRPRVYTAIIGARRHHRTKEKRVTTARAKTGRCTGATILIHPGNESRPTRDGDSEAHASSHTLRRVRGKQ